MNKKQEWVSELAQDIKKQGFRVFLAEKGTYGFYTDAEGSRVISFGLDLLAFTFSGNYKTDNPKQTGTGWRICEDCKDFKAIFNSFPPNWAVGCAKWKFETLAEHLKTYGSSSKYVEV